MYFVFALLLVLFVPTICNCKDKDLFIDPQEFVVGYSKANKEPRKHFEKTK